MMDTRRILRTVLTEISEAQSKAIAVTPKLSSFFSVLGSSYIIIDILLGKPRQKWKLYDEIILLGMSVCDIICSMAWFFSTWPIPPEVLPIWGALGITGTCTTQGFFAQLSLSTVFYNGFLSVYYLLVIKYGWKEERIRRYRLGTIIHVASLSVGIITATVAASLQLLNPVGYGCWIGAVPIGCEQSFMNGGDTTTMTTTTTCTRGDNATIYKWIFVFGPLWIVIGLVSVFMFTVTSAYTKRVNHMRNYSRMWARTNSGRATDIGNLYDETTTTTTTPPTTTLKKRSATAIERIMKKRKKVCKRIRRKNFLTGQMALYVGSFYIVWLFPTIIQIIESIGGRVGYIWIFFASMTMPLQGLFNAIVYVRPRLAGRRAKRKAEKIDRRKKAITPAIVTEATNKTLADDTERGDISQGNDSIETVQIDQSGRSSLLDALNCGGGDNQEIPEVRTSFELNNDAYTDVDRDSLIMQKPQQQQQVIREPNKQDIESHDLALSGTSVQCSASTSFEEGEIQTTTDPESDIIDQAAAADTTRLKMESEPLELRRQPELTTSTTLPDRYGNTDAGIPQKPSRRHQSQAEEHIIMKAQKPHGQQESSDRAASSSSNRRSVRFSLPDPNSRPVVGEDALHRVMEEEEEEARESSSDDDDFLASDDDSSSEDDDSFDYKFQVNGQPWSRSLRGLLSNRPQEQEQGENRKRMRSNFRRLTQAFSSFQRRSEGFFGKSQIAYSHEEKQDEANPVPRQSIFGLDDIQGLDVEDQSSTFYDSKTSDFQNTFLAFNDDSSCEVESDDFWNM